MLQLTQRLWWGNGAPTPDPKKWDGIFATAARRGYAGISVLASAIAEAEASRFVDLLLKHNLVLIAHVDTAAEVTLPAAAAGTEGNAAEVGEGGSKNAMEVDSNATTTTAEPATAETDTGAPAAPAVVKPRTPAEHLASFKLQLAAAVALHPVIVCSSSGSDAWSQPESVEFFTEAVALAASSAKVPVCHTTSLGRQLATPWQARELLAQVPGLKLNLDLGVWCFTAGRVFDGDGGDRPWWPQMLASAGGSAVVLAAGVGHAGAPRVPHPADRVHAHALEQHEQWWTTLWTTMLETQTAAATAAAESEGGGGAGAATATVYMEATMDPSYQQRMPCTGVVTTNVAEADMWLAARMQALYEEKVTAVAEAAAVAAAGEEESTVARMKREMNKLQAEAKAALKLQVDQTPDAEWNRLGIVTEVSKRATEATEQLYANIEAAAAEPQYPAVLLPGEKGVRMNYLLECKEMVYFTLDNETPRMVAKKFDLDFKEILLINKPYYPSLSGPSKLFESTILLLPCDPAVLESHPIKCQRLKVSLEQQRRLDFAADRRQNRKSKKARGIEEKRMAREQDRSDKKMDKMKVKQRVKDKAKRERKKQRALEKKNATPAQKAANAAKLVHLQPWIRAVAEARKFLQLVGFNVPKKGTEFHLISTYYKDQMRAYGKIKTLYVRGQPMAEINDSPLSQDKLAKAFAKADREAGILPGGEYGSDDEDSEEDDDDDDDDDEDDDEDDDLDDEDEDDEDEEPEDETIFRVYIASEDETPRQIAKKHDLTVKEILAVNKERIEGLRQHSKLMEGTTILLPMEEDKPAGGAAAAGEGDASAASLLLLVAAASSPEGDAPAKRKAGGQDGTPAQKAKNN